MDDDRTPARVVLPRGPMILLTLAAATITIGGLKASGGTFGPLFLALVLVITAYPIRPWLETRGVPRWLAAIATILAVYLALALIVIALVVSVGRLAALVPTYAPQINELSQQIGDWLLSHGVRREQVDALVKSLDFGKVFSVATSVLSSALGVMTNLLVIATLVLFLGFDAGNVPTHLEDAHGHRPAVVEALRIFVEGTRKYVSVSAGFGLAVAILDWIALLVLGIPAAIVWAVLSFVTNFIPNIGFVLGVVPPAVLALLEGGPGLMIIVVVVYTVINVVIQTVIQPKIVGDALGLSASLTFLSLIFWAWVLGPLGAILALPLTLLVKAMLVDVDPDARWLTPFLSGKPADRSGADTDPGEHPGEPGEGEHVGHHDEDDHRQA